MKLKIELLLPSFSAMLINDPVCVRIFLSPIFCFLLIISFDYICYQELLSKGLSKYLEIRSLAGQMIKLDHKGEGKVIVHILRGGVNEILNMGKVP